MAEVQVETGQEPEITGGIKATRLVDKEAEKIQKRVTLPKVPSRTITDSQWMEYARLLTPEMWPQISTMYLYRLKPKIIRQQSDPTNKNYIDKPDRIADLRSYVLKNHSWGKYRCEINRFLTGGGGEQKLVDVIIEITEEESPEFYLDVKELDKNDSSNMGLVNRLRAKGVIDDRGNVNDTPRGVQQAGVTVAQQDLMMMFDKMMNLVTRMNTEQKEELRARLASSGEAGLSGQIGNILLEKMKQDGPGNMASIISSTLSMAKEIMGPRNDNGNSDFVKMMMDQNKAMLDMQQKHSEAMIAILKEKAVAPEAGEKILDSVDAAMGIMERLSSLQGGGGKRNGWDTGLEYAKELGLPIFNAISQIYTVYKMGKPMDTTTVQAGQPAKPTGKTISGMEAAANAGRIAAGQKPAMYTGEPPSEIPAEVLPAVDPQLMGMLNMAAGPILKFMADDRSGADLAVVLIEMYGKPSHAQLANYGEDKILEAAKSVPEFWANFAVYGEDKVKQFLNEFIHYEEFLEEQGMEEEEEPKAKKGGKK